MSSLRLTVLGGGGFRVPLVYRALCEEDDGGARVDEVVLHDVSADRLHRMRLVLAHVESQVPAGLAPRVTVTTDLTEALRGADFVFSAIRVAGLRGRVCDERSAMAAGVLGQETTGAGGVCYGLRTVPEALRVASVIRDVAPEAWTINFTNPAGMVTEAMSAVLGDRVVGICDSPVGLCRRVARVLDVDASPRLADAGDGGAAGPPAAAGRTVRFDYAGLNHLGWLGRVLVDGVDVLPELLADTSRLERIEEGRLFGSDWLRTLGAIPNEYLWYWYFRTDALAAERDASETRGEFLLHQQGAFYDAVADADDPAAAYAQWERTRRERESSYMADSREISGAGERDADDLDGGGYDQVALALLRAIARDEPTELILNVRNAATLPFLDADAVVEVPCRVDAAGPVAATDVGPLSMHAQSLVTAVKDVERTTIEAARSGARDLAVRALALHPLVGSVPTARRILETELEALPELAAVLRR